VRTKVARPLTFDPTGINQHLKSVGQCALFPPKRNAQIRPTRCSTSNGTKHPPVQLSVAQLVILRNRKSTFPKKSGRWFQHSFDYPPVNIAIMGTISSGKIHVCRSSTNDGMKPERCIRVGR
jgi:hypothetical protein